jgi:uncharacterized protein (TIGR03382 family)
MRVALALALALLTAAPATAQVGIENPDLSTPTTLYFHLDAQQDFPINTQPPDDRYAKDDSRGLLAPTTSCIPDPSGQIGLVTQSFHTLYGFSTPGYVEYDFQEEGGPRIHPERGLAYDIEIDPGADANLYWYLRTRFAGGDSRLPADAVDDLPVVVPEVSVRATIRTGDDVSIGGAAYNAGSLIAQGTSAPMLVAPDASNPHYIPDDGMHLYEFVVPLAIGAGSIPADEAFNIRVDVFMNIPGCETDPDESLMLSQVDTHTSPEYRPRLDWSIMNPVAIEYIHPQFIGDQLLIHTAMSSPWGNYDVDETPGGIEVIVAGPSEARSLARTAFTQRHHEHGHHFEPVDVTYSWPYKLDGAQRGEYAIEVRARNDQGTGMAIGRALFEIGPNTAVDSDGNPVVQAGGDEAQDSPLPLLPLVGLVAAAWLARRR